jgi:hypothetical protein
VGDRGAARATASVIWISPMERTIVFAFALFSVGFTAEIYVSMTGI